MGQQDVSRIRTYEENNTFISPSLDNLIKEIDSRLSGAECYPTISRVNNLITQIDYFSDILRTKKVMMRTFSRTLGTNNVLYITGIISIFYNDNGSEDSRVTTTISRIGNLITDCNNVFSSGESLC